MALHNVGISMIAGAVIAASSYLGMHQSYAQNAAPECEMLFVQNADSVTMDKETVKLTGASPLVSFFCDRPVRHAGHLTNAEYLQSWDAAKDSFTDDPPNAMVSVLDGDIAHDVVVEFLGKPTVEGDKFTYRIAIIDGEPVPGNSAGSLFIDIIGRPLTPLSYAGVAPMESPAGEEGFSSLKSSKQDRCVSCAICSTHRLPKCVPAVL